MALGRYGGVGGTGAVVWEMVRSAKLGAVGGSGGRCRCTGDEEV